MCSPSSSIGSNHHIIKGREHLSMCFFAWRHAMVVERDWGAERHRGGVGRPPMIGGASPNLLEGCLTCHKWVCMAGDVCHVGCIAMTHQWSVWCFIRAFDVEPTWDQWWRSLRGPLPRISDVTGAGGASGGALVGPVGMAKWAQGPPTTSTCLLCPFSLPFYTNFAIIPAYK